MASNAENKSDDRNPDEFPFIATPEGWCFLERSKGGAIRERWVCSPLKIAAMTRNIDNVDWGMHLEIVDLDGKTHTWAMPMQLLAGTGDEYRERLLSMGLRIAPGQGKQRLHLLLTLLKTSSRVRCVNRIGWHDKVFVLPDCMFGDATAKNDEEIVLQGHDESDVFRVSGSLQDWREAIGRHCPGNTRLAFAVASAFAAPLLALTMTESGGFHFVGGSSMGKTTVLLAAGSVCGGDDMRGFVRQWRTTDNGLEAVAVSHCDSLLCLDEVGQASASTAAETAYMLTNGQGKQRANRNGDKRPAHTWRVLFLSTGEITLADKIREDQRLRAMSGQAVRLVDIPIDAGAGHGAFETLYGFENAGCFARHLGTASKQVYGAPLRSFLKLVCDDIKGCADQSVHLANAFYARHLPQKSSEQVQRVCRRFALVAAAGELATSMGVLPWPTVTSEESALACFHAWLDLRAGLGPGEVETGIAQIRAFIEAHGASRFEDYDSANAGKVLNRVGFKRKNRDGVYDYLVFPEAFRKELCQGLDPKTICRALIERGFLKPSGPRDFNRSERLPGLGPTRVYRLTSHLLGDVEIADECPSLPSQAETHDTHDTLLRSKDFSVSESGPKARDARDGLFNPSQARNECNGSRPNPVDTENVCQNNRVTDVTRVTGTINKLRGIEAWPSDLPQSREAIERYLLTKPDFRCCPNSKPKWQWAKHSACRCCHGHPDCLYEPGAKDTPSA